MSLNFKHVPIEGLVLIEPVVKKDGRGYFMEKYRRKDFAEAGIPDFVQDNYSFSNRGVIRALHYQLAPHAQGKLVSVVSGKAWDVAVDLRQSSATFGKWFGVELSEDNNLSFYIPPGFAHGFAAISTEVRFFYKCTSEYDPASERGIIWNDPALAIDWHVSNPILADRDLVWPRLDKAETFI
ncbi:MAG: dTDP-4-dehydrorhamnose 3,5-epimerase [Candidatus Vogelbacteria bacterium]|nr:dTDP-4-dehydrorhamnose 3,5-epimerase [Candidatus Vogelbacteria bacterium]